MQVTACVARVRGNAHQPANNLTVHTGRLDRQQMQQLIQQEGFDLVIDATHPYAAVVTQNIAAACAPKPTSRSYRCLRESEQDRMSWRPHTFDGTGHRAGSPICWRIEGNILLTTGSKELPATGRSRASPSGFTRGCCRFANVVESCLALGIPAAHLIAMQGLLGDEPCHDSPVEHLLPCHTRNQGKTGGVDKSWQQQSKRASPCCSSAVPAGRSQAGRSRRSSRACGSAGIRPVPAAPKPGCTASAFRCSFRCTAGGRWWSAEEK